MRWRWLLALLALLATTAEAPQRFDERVRELFFSGFAGVSADLAKGMAICDTALRENPADPAALVWHGSGTFFMGGMAFREGRSADGRRLQEQGLAEMDRAVELLPDSPQTRAARGPALMEAARYAPADIAEPWLRRAMTDFAVVEAVNARSSAPSEHDRGEVLGALAEGWDRLGDSARGRAYAERIVAELPASNYAKRASEWLATGNRPERMTCLSCHKKGG